ncbi:MAG TPA: rhamnulose-1-phosphate aldolase [Bacteroidales bacterium]|nr:rhamnulose-1-phosphate aldolase [Bacteroidales bacterium]
MMEQHLLHAFDEPRSIAKMISEVQEVAGYLWAKGWSEKNAGNITLRLPQRVRESLIRNSGTDSLDFSVPQLASACFFVTCTGKRMRDIAKDPLANCIFVQVNSNGDGYEIVSLAEDTLKPTSELPSHLSIHNMLAKRGTGENVVLHTHATELVALTQFSGIKSTESLNKILWGMHPETMVFIPKGIGFVPYLLPGTLQIAEATMEEFKKHDIVLWEKHGVFAIGKNVLDTFDNIDIASKSASIWFQCRAAGFEPEGLTEKQLDELMELVKKFNIVE